MAARSTYSINYQQGFLDQEDDEEHLNQHSTSPGGTYRNNTSNSHAMAGGHSSSSNSTTSSSRHHQQQQYHDADGDADGDGADLASDAGSDTVLSMPGKGFEPESGMKFKSIPVVWALVVEVLVMVAYCVLLFLELPVDYPIGEDEKDQLFLFSVLLHVVMCVFVGLITFYVEYFFRKVRYQGHLNFHRESKSKRSFPVLILSVGNAVILLLFCLWSSSESYLDLQRINILQIIVTVETFLITIDIFIVGRLVLVFNASKPLPDASEELVPGFEAVNMHQDNRINHDLGFSEEDYLDDVMEKQGDMIKYLQQQKENLSLRIVQLTERLRQHEQANDQPTESDYQYLLKSKDNEMRMAVAERNQTIQRLEAQVDSLKAQLQQG